MNTLERFRQKDPLALSKVISHVENRLSDYQKLLATLYPQTGRAYRIGLTGPPGAGKSTLADKLTLLLVNEKKSVGIIAVDPTSPFTGGALLGDRIRMQDLTEKKEVFIRSMATRGSVGGLAETTRDVALVLDAFGKEFIFIETVGVGQVELDIAEACDTTLVILVPESGDAIQAMKAGLMEIADIFVINKADRPGAARIISELEMILDTRRKMEGWQYPIVATEAINSKGIELLWQKISEHRQVISANGALEAKRRHQVKVQIEKLMASKVQEEVEGKILHGVNLDEVAGRVFRHEVDPYSVCDELWRKRSRLSQ